MNKHIILNKTLVIAIFILFIGAGFSSVIGSDFNSEQDVSSLTFYAFSRTGTRKCKVELESDVIEEISVMFEDLKNKLTCDPMSDSTQRLKVDFVDLLDVNNLIPEDLSRDYVFSLLNPSWLKWIVSDSPFLRNGFFNSLGSRFGKIFNLDSFSHTGFSAFCSIAGGGSGLQFPPIIIPRPRFVHFWAAYIDAYTTAANLITGRGFVADGPQFGLNLGFMGVGLTWAIPGEPAYFGFGGYSLFSMVGAEEVVDYPLNNEPIISEEVPADGKWNVPLTLSELSFRISDAEGDRMNYWVTTKPDIGSGQGFNKKDGRYTVSVSDLEYDKAYSWTISVSDGEDTTEETFTFRTVVEPPIVSDPNPANGDDWVSAYLSELSFKLHDIQGDLMDYTVETVPDIGSGSGNGVNGGLYSIDVSGLDLTTEYTWFVNVTDGKYWTRKVFGFKTQPNMVFNPFLKGWKYRKKITVDHSLVAGDLSDFPVLVNVVDSDLKNKAQNDGDDILFMDGPGVASRLFHEIERWDSTSGELVVWVNVNSLSSSSDTEIWLYYGNNDVSSQEYISRTWSSDFAEVYHFEDDGSVLTDSLGNEIPTNHGCVAGHAGIVGDGLYADGNNDYVDGFDNMYGDRSFSLWYNVNSFSGVNEYGIVASYHFDFNTFIVYPNGNLRAYFEGGYKFWDNLISMDTWYHLAATQDVDTDTDCIYTNGNEWAGGTDDIAPGNFGRLLYYDNDRVAISTLDEFRIYQSVMSSDWFKTEYNSIKYGWDGGFFSIGPEEIGP